MEHFDVNSIQSDKMQGQKIIYESFTEERIILIKIPILVVLRIKTYLLLVRLLVKLLIQLWCFLQLKQIQDEYFLIVSMDDYKEMNVEPKLLSNFMLRLKKFPLKYEVCLFQEIQTAKLYGTFETLINIAIDGLK